MDRAETLYNNAERFANYYYDLAKDGRVAAMTPYEKDLLKQGRGPFIDYYANAMKLNLEKDYAEGDWDDEKAERLNKMKPEDGVSYVLFGGQSPEQKNYREEFSKFKEIIEDGKWYQMSPKEISVWAKGKGYDWSSDKDRNRFWDNLKKFDVDYNRAKLVSDEMHSPMGIYSMFAAPTLAAESVRQSLTGDFDDDKANAAKWTDIAASSLLGGAAKLRAPLAAATTAGGIEAARQGANMYFGNETNWGAPLGAGLAAGTVPSLARYVGGTLSQGSSTGARPFARGFSRGLRGADDPIVAERNALKQTLINARKQSSNAQAAATGEPVGAISGVSDLENARAWDNAATKLEALGFDRRYIQQQLDKDVSVAEKEFNLAKQRLDQVIDSRGVLSPADHSAAVEAQGRLVDAAQERFNKAVEARSAFDMNSSTIATPKAGQVYVEDVIGPNPDYVQGGPVKVSLNPEYSVEYVLKNSYDKPARFPSMSATQFGGRAAYDENARGLGMLREAFPEKYSKELGEGSGKKLYNLGLTLGNVASDVGAPVETAYRLTPSDIGLMLKGDSGTFDQKIENFKQSEWYKKLPEQKKNIIEEAFKKAAQKRKE